MHTPRFTRRQFLKGACATAAAGAVGPRLLFGSDARAAASDGDVVVVLFLRGAMDGLNFVVPMGSSDRAYYESVRPSLNIAASGTYGALPLTYSDGSASDFGLHPSATGLRDLWNAGRVAIVHAAGLTTSASRSHFDAQMAIEQGAARGLNSGWMARAIATQSGTDAAAMAALACMSREPASLNGTTRAITMESPSDFQLNGGAWAWMKTRSDSPAGLVGMQETLKQLWGGETGLETSGALAERALRVVATQPYAPPPAAWPTSTIARELWTVAQSIRFGVGLRYAAVDLGGWDTHDGQGTAGAGYHYYQNKIAELSQALSAFQAELEASGVATRVTTVVQSEFGRRIRQNAAGGTDHGCGNPMLVMGGAVNGRRFYGQWPGLTDAVIASANGDLPVTTDYRRVLSEILVRRMRNSNLSTIFPGYAAYAPLGLVQGTDMAAASQASVGAYSMATAAPVQSAQDLAIEAGLRARGGSVRDRILRRVF
ncbi:DUF1501 domain-containing protein [Cognatilysobacter segetis]|uniref:DUF1501 domain-containing protein n=1 Tax=Cognatilysobacter segetis TaxID=2492394 RepID=UPI00105DF4A3|nr:DUF1501 domain-containing protein [Lysobacter segetis]